MGLPADTPRDQDLSDASADPQRRGFLIHTATALVGGVVAIVPLVAGLFTFLDPVRRASGGGKFIPVTTLDGLPEDGIPRQFPVIADRVDAWNRYPKEPIGAVYLIRRKGKPIEAFTATCPHAGCFIAYSAEKKYFQCPCHKSAFDVEGHRLLEISKVPPRNMDSLEVKTEGNHILVKFVNFYAGRPEKKAKA